MDVKASVLLLVAGEYLGYQKTMVTAWDQHSGVFGAVRGKPGEAAFGAAIKEVRGLLMCSGYMPSCCCPTFRKSHRIVGLDLMVSIAYLADYSCRNIFSLTILSILLE